MTIDSKYRRARRSPCTPTSSRRVVRSVDARATACPACASAFVPQPVMGKTRGELRAYVDGIDPITGRPVMQEVIEGLTAAARRRGPAESRPSSARRRAWSSRTPRTTCSELFLENNWTDKLPIVLPTEERVAAMLAHTSHKPDEVVGHMRPTHFREAWEYTVEKVAVNAVMAGARPEYFPVILALAATGVSARGSTYQLDGRDGGGQRPDPPRDRHELRASARWGRTTTPTPPSAAPTACCRRTCQGGSVAGPDLHGLAGQRLRLQQPHASPRTRSAARGSRSTSQHGFKPTDSTVSVFSGCRSRRSPSACARSTGASTCATCCAAWTRTSTPTVRARSDHGAPVRRPRRLRHQGEADRLGLRERAACRPSEYWDYQLIQNYVYPRATFGEEPYASMLKAAPDELIQMFKRDEIHVVVVGGETNGYWRIMGCSYQKTVSVDEWR